MMVETMLESSQDFGMSNGALPQWKRELLQRRAARSRGSAPAAQTPPPPPAPPADEDEELRYGPGIVKRLKSRYLSLALRDAPRRRPSCLRRAASLEHLLDERPPPVPCARPTIHPRPPRPQSMAAQPALLAPAQRRESVKRARSVDALSRIDVREDSRAISFSPQPPPPPPIASKPPHHSQTRCARTPRRPTPLLRETERPPPDVVRSTLRKFEAVPTRRPAPAARVSAVLRGLEGPRTSTPEPRDPADGLPLSPRTPSPLVPAEPAPAAAPAPQTEAAPEGVAGVRPVSRAALDGIARAGSSVRYAFEAPCAASHLPPLAATNSVLLGRARRVGVIRPMPARIAETTGPAVEEIEEKASEQTSRLTSPVPSASPPPPLDNETSPPTRAERREPPPAALVEPIPRTPPDAPHPVTAPRSPPPAIIERNPSPEPKTKPKPTTKTAPLTNGHTSPERTLENKGTISRIGTAGIERAWSGSNEKKVREVTEKAVPWASGSPLATSRAASLASPASPAAARRSRVPPPASTSVVFNFSNRKEVPDYIENDGIILRGSRRNRIKPGEAGVVVLRPEALARSDSDSESELDGGPPSPCTVRFINDNVLINGKSSMPGKPNKDRVSKLKLQFDDSLTRTFEYPSETSLCEESASSPTEGAAAPPGGGSSHTTPQLAESPLHAPLAANTHIASATLSRYTPSKTVAGAFQLGVTRHDTCDTDNNNIASSDEQGVGEGGAGEGDARPCGADVARSWSEARTLTTDLLF